MVQQTSQGNIEYALLVFLFPIMSFTTFTPCVTLTEIELFGSNVNK